MFPDVLHWQKSQSTCHDTRTDRLPLPIQKKGGGGVLYRRARVIGNLVKLISNKCLSCPNSQPQMRRQSYNSAG